jgi:glycosyltransferase involved in cell wall biosynthesis
VSVIIPAYNAARSLAKCIDSVLGQSLRALEVIVVNDGSTDETKRVAEGFADQIVFTEQSNQGQGAARNAGLHLSRGKYVTFLDADDYWLPCFLERCVAFLDSHPEAIAVSTGIIVHS